MCLQVVSPFRCGHFETKAVRLIYGCYWFLQHYSWIYESAFSLLTCGECNKSLKLSNRTNSCRVHQFSGWEGSRTTLYLKYPQLTFSCSCRKNCNSYVHFYRLFITLHNCNLSSWTKFTQRWLDLCIYFPALNAENDSLFLRNATQLDDSKSYSRGSSFPSDFKK